MNPEVLDLPSLSLGSVIPVSLVEQATGVRARHPDFRLACLQVKECVERYFHDERGQVVTVVTEGGAVRLLTHIEASEHNENDESRRYRGYRRCVRRMAAVDASAFSDEDRERHARALHLMRQTAAAMGHARRAARRLEELTAGE